MSRETLPLLRLRADDVACRVLVVGVCVDGNPTRAAEDMSEYDPHREVVVEGVDRILRIALAALVGVDAGR